MDKMMGKSFGIGFISYVACIGYSLYLGDNAFVISGWTSFLFT